jgi:hypothetical protein
MRSYTLETSLRAIEPHLATLRCEGPRAQSATGALLKAKEHTMPAYLSPGVDLQEGDQEGDTRRRQAVGWGPVAGGR